MRISTVAMLAVAVASAGCAKKNPETTAAPVQASAQSSSIKKSTNVITGAELADVTAQNLYQAIQILRPNWFRQRSHTTMGGTNRTGGANDVLVVYMESTRYGDVSALQQLTTTGVSELRYYDPSEATNRFGTGHTQGAIVIRMTRKP